MADDETTDTTPEHLSFGERLKAAMEEHGPLCVGIDPHPGLFDHWDLPHTAKGLERFTMRCVEAFSGTVAAVKPQSAFYEQFGSAGIAVLEKALATLRDAGTLTVLDAKRGDIGSTMAAYAMAYLSDHAPLRADAVTLSPYLGYGSLRPAIDTALGTGRGVFVLALTSNPEGASVQHAGGPGASVAGGIVAAVREDNLKAARKGLLGSVGMVVGATTGTAVEHLGLDLASANGPLLAPGIGAQGATGEDLRRVFGAALPHVLAASSREVLAAGPDVAALRDRARATADGLRELLA
jgi:orotidine-5'-phosphate decarboxylase